MVYRALNFLTTLADRSIEEDCKSSDATTDEDSDVKLERPRLTLAESVPSQTEEDEGTVGVSDKSVASRKTWKSKLPEPGPVITEVPFKAGDLVQGKVIFSNINGARVEVLCGVPGVIG